MKNIEKKFTELNAYLKSKYVGIDNVIDEVLFHFENWIRFRDYQESPYTVCLWGMTGTGKSSLIEEIINKLKMQDVYFPVDMGYAHNTKKDIFDFDNNDYNKDHALFVFDEFQHLVSHRSREEFETENSRTIWNFLDKGTIDFHSSNYELMFKIKLLQNLVKKMLPIGFDVQYNRVHDKLDIYKNLVAEFKKQYPTNDLFNDSRFGGIEIEDDHGDIIPESMIEDIFNDILQNDNDRQKFLDLINTNDLNKILEALGYTYYKGRASKQRDLKKSIVFIIGNLDEAYNMVVDVNVDHEADDINELSKKVGMSEIRSALYRRLRPEQIGRLGNNHIVYPALSRSDLRNVISIKLDEIKEKFSENKQIELEFDESIIDLIYNDGVIPSQGARPVISTINSYIRGNLNLVMSDLDNEHTKVLWKFKDNNFLLEFHSENRSFEKVEPIRIRLKQSELKRKRDPRLDSVIAVHEAGHAVAYIALVGKTPIRLQISNTGKSGWNKYEENGLSRGLDIKNNIIVRHSGRVAEEIVFGSENVTSGGHVDLQQLTRMALEYYSLYGFGDKQVFSRSPKERMPSSFIPFNKSLFKAAEQLVEVQKEESHKILNKYIDLVIIIAEELLQKRSLSKAELTKLVERSPFNDLLKDLEFDYAARLKEFGSMANC